ncbi:MAG: M15 family metallopeptidase [Rhodanobacteraceae bacterium]
MTRSCLARFGGGLVLCAACAGLAHASAASATPVACGPVPQPVISTYRDRIDAMDRKLGVPVDYAESHLLVPVPEAPALVVAGRDIRGRPVRLAPPAAVALQEMIVAAEVRDVKLQIVSGYRSASYQAGLLRDKLGRGMKIDSALGINAPPGYSEHQSGCAVDLTTPHSRAADESFARTRAYAWLMQYAAEYGFHLSYPRDNPHGIEFEPWHWRYVVPVGANTPGAAASPQPTSGE